MPYKILSILCLADTRVSASGGGGASIRSGSPRFSKNAFNREATYENPCSHASRARLTCPAKTVSTIPLTFHRADASEQPERSDNGCSLESLGGDQPPTRCRSL